VAALLVLTPVLSYNRLSIARYVSPGFPLHGFAERYETPALRNEEEKAISEYLNSKKKSQ
jgi:hypothetical protein